MLMANNTLLVGFLEKLKANFSGFLGLESYKIAKKRGAISGSPFFINERSANLEIPPQTKDYSLPVSPSALPSLIRRLIKKSRLRLASPAAQVRGIVVQDGDPKALPRHEEIPEIPLVDDDTVAAELIAARARREVPSMTAAVIVALKVITCQHRARSSRRSRQQSLRAPQIEIMTDQEVPRLLIHTSIVIRVPVIHEAHDGAEGVWAISPLNPRTNPVLHAVDNARCATIKQRLLAGRTMVPYPVAVATHSSPRIVIAENVCDGEAETRYPTISDPAKRIDAEVKHLGLFVGPHARPVLTCALGAYNKIEVPSTRNP